jgi:tetratricopeptide (TPR) repeat protein/tRNA A-37 threonylcarbamoyl transferase component Bud32
VTSRYTPLRFHDKGGLGEVHLAHDEELHRDVALKRIQAPYAADADSRRRFLLEAEVTARLEHPGVVPVHGLVQDENGHPCYAMRFIQGETLRDAIDRFHQADRPGRDPAERSLGLRQLLGRFIAVCNTIAYAHSRGILHRDIKPSNVMLGKYGETLVVDWGLAKAFERDEEVRTTSGEVTLTPQSDEEQAQGTQLGQTIGTPAYMSPEQAAGRWPLVGPASDIYSLGATLYYLLTGQPPFTEKRRDLLLCQVQEGQVRAPREIKPQTPAPLAAICLKAMALKREERYADALELAADVDRWLADEAVRAWREPWRLRARRWLRRHLAIATGTAAAVAVAALSLGVGLAVVAGKNAELDTEKTKLSQANTALDTANTGLVQSNQALEQANEREKGERHKAEQARAAADQARKQAQTVSDFLVKSFRKPDPYVESNQLKVVDLLAQAVRELNDDRQMDALIKAKLQAALGETYLGLWEGKNAIAILQRSGATLERHLGLEHPDTLSAHHKLARAYMIAGRTQEALELNQRTSELREKKLGPEHPDTLTSRNELGVAYRYAGRTEEAIKLGRQTLTLREKKLGPEHPDTLGSRNELAIAYLEAGRTQEAIKLHQQTLELLEKQLGPDHPDTLHSRNNLATAYLHAGRTQEALELNQRTLELREKKLGSEHPDTLTSRNNLGVAYLDAGRPEEAIKLLQPTLEALEKKLGPDHIDTLRSRSSLASALKGGGRMREAIQLYQQTLELSEKKLGPEHPDTLITRSSLAAAYQRAGRTHDAIQLYQQNLLLREKKLGPEHPDTLTSRHYLANCYRTAGRIQDAIRAFRIWV